MTAAARLNFGVLEKGFSARLKSADFGEEQDNLLPKATKKFADQRGGDLKNVAALTQTFVREKMTSILKWIVRLMFVGFRIIFAILK
ncbi:MAG: hypothetical protein LBU73_05990 [Helicobacteraceae bacterium]|jgi:hypothetical protein|nr:hypothetical protein [Helicobacteraceae bacterium]